MGNSLVGDHLSRGTKLLGTICQWGPNLMGTVCPGGSILWGSFVQGNRKRGTRSPGIKWVWDQMCCSLLEKCFFSFSTQVQGNRNTPSERMFKPIMPRKVSPNESPWEIQLKKKATTTYLSPVVDPFVCVYLLVVSSSSSRLVYLYLSSVAQKSNN